MKIEGEVIAVSGNGETLTVRLQGNEVGAAQWRNMGVQEFQISETRRTQRAFHLGRKVSIEIRPK